MECWEKTERAVLLLACAFLVAASIWALLAGSSLLWLAAVCWPFAVWRVWQVFFEERADPEALPTRTELLMASAWLWFRRIVLGALALLFGSIGVRGGLENDSAALLIGLGLAAFSLWVALFGAGRQSSMLDDRAVHAKRRARYKWWL